MDSSPPCLSPLQAALIAAFFTSPPSTFRLSGGAALAGYHLHHRMTDDIDLFTADQAALPLAVRHLEQCSQALRATCTALQSTPNFRRFLVQADAEACEVDLVVDKTPTVAAAEIIDGICVDAAREIAANKVTTLLSRTEVRDLVDLMVLLDQPGLDFAQAYQDAQCKDASLSPDVLVMTLGWIPLGEARSLRGLRLDIDKLTRFRDALQRKLRAMAFPKP